MNQEIFQHQMDATYGSYGQRNQIKNKNRKQKNKKKIGKNFNKKNLNTQKCENRNERKEMKRVAVPITCVHAT